MRINHIFILSGPVHSGKTSLAHQVCLKLLESNISINGVLSTAYFEGSVHLGYNGLALPSFKSFPLIRSSGLPEWQQVGRFFFLPEGMKSAIKAICSFQDSDLTVIDEMGPLELNGQGYWSAFESLIAKTQPILVVIRDQLVTSFLERIQAEVEIFEIGSPDLFSTMIERIKTSTNIKI